MQSWVKAKYFLMTYKDIKVSHKNNLSYSRIRFQLMAVILLISVRRGNTVNKGY